MRPSRPWKVAWSKVKRYSCPSWKNSEQPAGATQHTLTNAVTAKLTPQQMTDLVEVDEVQLIRLEAIDHVTCMNESALVIETNTARREFNVTGQGVRVQFSIQGLTPRIRL